MLEKRGEFKFLRFNIIFIILFTIINKTESKSHLSKTLIYVGHTNKKYPKFGK